MRHCFRHLTFVVCLAASPLGAQQGPASLVADLETTVVPSGGFDPYGFTELGGFSYFGAWDEAHGYELWRTDGTAAGTQIVIDLQPGPIASLPMDFTVVGGTLFFTANDGRGFGLWKTDGTAAGTVLVKGADLSAGFSKPRRMAAFGAGLMLVAGRYPSAPALWISDGTEAGTVRLRALGEPGETGFGLDERLPIAVTGAQAFVTTYSNWNAGGSFSIWRSDGTVAGTQRVWSGPLSSSPSYLPAGGKLYFDGGDGLWVTDGTPGSAARLGGSGSGQLRVLWLTEHAGQIFFGEGYVFSGASFLWRTDGTVAGTQQVPVSFRFTQLTSVGQRLLLVAATGSDLNALCQLQGGDGTPGGFVPLSGSVSCHVPSGTIAVVPGGAFYRLEPKDTYPVPPATVGFTDGTPAGTRVLLQEPMPLVDRSADFAAARWRGPRGSFASPLGLRNVLRGPGGLADGGPIPPLIVEVRLRDALWVSDRTPEGTSRALASTRTWHARPHSLVAHGQDVLLSFDQFPPSGASTYEQPLVVGSLDPASGHVRELAQIPDSYGYCWSMLGEPRPAAGRIALLGDRADLTAFCEEPNPSSGVIWALGTVGGTDRPRIVDQSDGFGATINGHLVYQVFTPYYAAPGQLRAHDGGPGGGVVLAELGEIGFGPQSPSFQQVGARLFVWTGDFQLWVTDGTPGGTSHLASWLVAGDMESFQGRLYFAATQEGVGPNALWVSDGTAGGTVVVATGMSRLSRLTSVGGQLFFSAWDAAHGQELWVSDGTKEGTRLVTDVRPGAEGSAPEGLVAFGSLVAFVADDGVSGRELWVSDGTAGGTYRVADVWPGAASALGRGAELVSDGQHVFFPAYRPESGIELWVSDGTEAGTHLLQEIAPGAASSSPEELTIMGGRLYCSADDGVHGRELWALPLSGPWLTVNEPEVPEGDAGVSWLEYELRLETALAQATSMSWRTVSGGTATLGEDYGAVTGTVTFAAGETVKTVKVPVFGDRLKEGTETVRIEVSPEPGLRIPATGRIVDDDALVAGPRDTYVYERPGALALARVRVDQQAAVKPGAWSYATRDGQAQAGSDYVSSSGPLPASGVIEAGVLPDSLREGPEGFFVDVTGSGGGTESARVTILDAWSRGDFDGDGQSDLLLREETSGALQVWAMNGTTRTSVLSTTPTGIADLQWRVAGTNDFDGDGLTDVVWRHETSGKVVVWLMNGVQRVAGSFTSPSGVTDTTWKLRATGEVDGDGQADLLWQQGQTGRLVTWLMNGLSRREGRFLVPDAPESAQWRAVGLADLTGDGRADLVLQHGLSGRVVVWELESGVRRRGSVLLPELTRAGQHVVAVGDWNADGATDLLLWNEGDGELEAWLLSGLALLEARKLDPQALPPGWRVAGPR